MRDALKVVGSFFGWVFTLLAIIAFVFAGFSFLNSKRTGEPVTIMGYRPVYVLTGSMEPYMMTDSIVITKTVEEDEKYEIGDVVTYHVEDEKGKTLVITHRIYQFLDDGSIITKGDNNNVKDSYPITNENIEAKVVKPLNWVATLVHLWDTPKGKIIIICGISGLVVMYFAIHAFIEPDDSAKDEEGEEVETDDTPPEEENKEDNDNEESEEIE